jgi:hypothetical protein
VKRSYAEDRLGYLTVEESAELEHLRGVAPAQVAAHADDEPPRFPERIAELKAKHPSPHGSCTGHRRNGLTRGHDPNC